MNTIQLFYGDCFELLQYFPQKSVDLILIDPPYGMTKNTWDILWDLEKMWFLVNRVSKNGLVIAFGSGLFTAKLIMSNEKDFKFNYIWQKNKATGHFNVKRQPMKAHEEISVFSKKNFVYNPQKTTGHKPVNSFTKRNTESNNCYGHDTRIISGGGSTERYPTTILDYKVIRNDHPNRVHPNQKPTKLYEFLIKTHSNKGDVIMDLGMGSGSSGVACLWTERKYIGIEKEERFFKSASDWIEREENWKSKSKDTVAFIFER